VRGTVVRVFLSKGYGFVRGEDGHVRFMQVSDFEPPIAFEHLREGQVLEFTPVENTGKGNGLRAVRVRTVPTAGVNRG